MRVAPPLYIVDIIGEVVEAVNAVVYPPIDISTPNPKKIFYTYGRSIQILTELQKKNNGTDQKKTKYPLFALFQDFPESTGTGYYVTVKFPKIVIATLTQSSDPVTKRYEQTFKPILYPIYEEFKRQLARHPNIIGNDPNAFSMIKWDRPGTQPAADKAQASNFNDFIDAIEIQNLELTFKQVINCKPL